MSTKHTDLCIIGSGMVGLTTACLAAKAGFSVAIIDADQAPPRLTPDSDYRLRVSAINAASAQLFKYIGAWPLIQHTRVNPYTQMHVWEGDTDTDTHSIHFDAGELGTDQLGYIIENDLICQALNDQLEHLPNVQRWQQERLQALTPDREDDCLIAELQHRQIQARLVVGVDGAQSFTRQLAQIPVSRSHYQQVAIVAQIQTERAHQFTAHQRFLPTGPLGVLPLADGSSSIVWSNDQTQADELLACASDQFEARLSDALSAHLGSITLLSPRYHFPLEQIHAERYIGERVALVGDAAHRTHPLAGLGANIGFVDAAALVETLQHAKQQRRDIGLAHALRKYERRQHTQNARTLDIMQGFKTAFGHSHAGIQNLRQTGLTLVNQLPPIKHQLMRHAMGLSGDLPDFCLPRH